MRNKSEFLIKQKTQKFSFLNNGNKRSINIKNELGRDVNPLTDKNEHTGF